jgi:hypothetical protein
MLFVLVYVRVVILLTFGKHVHHNIMSLSGEAWALVPFIEVPVPSQESQRSVAVPSQESQRSVAVPSQIFEIFFRELSMHIWKKSMVQDRNRKK